MAVFEKVVVAEVGDGEFPGAPRRGGELLRREFRPRLQQESAVADQLQMHPRNLAEPAEEPEGRSVSGFEFRHTASAVAVGEPQARFVQGERRQPGVGEQREIIPPPERGPLERRLPAHAAGERRGDVLLPPDQSGRVAQLLHGDRGQKQPHGVGQFHFDGDPVRPAEPAPARVAAPAAQRDAVGPRFDARLDFLRERGPGGAQEIGCAEELPPVGGENGFRQRGRRVETQGVAPGLDPVAVLPDRVFRDGAGRGRGGLLLRNSGFQQQNVPGGE